MARVMRFESVENSLIGKALKSPRLLSSQYLLCSSLEVSAHGEQLVSKTSMAL